MVKCMVCGCPQPPPGRLIVGGVGSFPDTEGVDLALAYAGRCRMVSVLALIAAFAGWGAALFFAFGNGQTGGGF